MVSHAPYLPALASLNFSFNPKLTKFCTGKKYRSDKDVAVVTNEYFEQLDEIAYSDVIKAREYRWTKCIEP